MALSLDCKTVLVRNIETPSVKKATNLMHGVAALDRPGAAVTATERGSGRKEGEGKEREGGSTGEHGE